MVAKWRGRIHSTGTVRGAVLQGSIGKLQALPTTTHGEARWVKAAMRAELQCTKETHFCANNACISPSEPNKYVKRASYNVQDGVLQYMHPGAPHLLLSTSPTRIIQYSTYHDRFNTLFSRALRIKPPEESSPIEPDEFREFPNSGKRASLGCTVCMKYGTC